MANIRQLKPCTCGSGTSAIKHRDDDQVIRFLKGLNEQYFAIKSQIMLIDPLPSINRVFNPVLQQERELHVSLEQKILLAKTNSVSDAKPKQCTFYGKPRHTEATCYRKHSFPPRFKFRSNGSSSSVHNISTQTTGNVPPISHAIASSTPIQSPQPSVLPQLSATQYTRLLSLLNSSSTPVAPQSTINLISTSSNPLTGMCLSLSSLSSTLWIIDSGAIDHVCSLLSLFSSYHSISPLSMRLPTGSCVVACFSGTVRISDSLILEDVLYLPDFSFNILSVSHLTSTVHCSLIFSTSSC